jgi:ribose 5-phosphate isomerase B
MIMSHQPIRLLLGGDSAGFDYKNAILADMQADERVEVVEDLGVYAGGLENASYPQVAIAAAEKIAAGEADRAILVCGTGIGVAIAANKVPGIRAALCGDAKTAEGARTWNDANVLALSLRTTSEAELEEILDAWFAAGPSPEADDRANIEHVAEIDAR